MPTRMAAAHRPRAMGLPVPLPGPEVCTRCSGPARHGPGECWCCRQVGQTLGEDEGHGPPVVPLALCRPGDALHAALRRYKDAPVAEARRHHAAVLGRLVDARLSSPPAPVQPAAPAGLLLPGAFDAVVAVPSSSRAPGAGSAPCPLDVVLDASLALSAVPRLVLARGAGGCGHLRPSRRAFVPAEPVAGRRIVVVEDTWVTGARARSATAALTAAGAEVVGVLVLGRAVDPAAAPAVARWWLQVATGRLPAAGRLPAPSTGGRRGPGKMLAVPDGAVTGGAG